MTERAIAYDPFSWAVQDDPYPYYRRLRDEAPVYYVAERDLWVVSRWDDCMAVLTNPAQWSNARGNFFNDVPERIGKVMATNDPPRHTLLRSLVEQVLSPERVERLEPVIRAMARGLIGRFGDSGSVEFVGAFASNLTAGLMGYLFGVPQADFPQLRGWLSAAVQTSESSGPSKPAPEFQLLFGYIARLVAERRANPGDDMVSGLIAAEQDGYQLSDIEIVTEIGTLIAAAIQSMNMQLGNIALALALHPDQRAIVRANPALIPAAIEEAVRWESALQGLLRSATSDAEVAGVRIPAGGWLLVSFASANRDERQFPEAERFLIDRAADEHLGFSWGAHRCIGRPLGRLTMRVAFEELLPVLGDYQLDLARAERTRNPNMRGFKTLPLRFG